MMQGSAVYLQEGCILGGLCPLVLLDDTPGFACFTHWCTSAANDDWAAQVEGVHPAAREHNAHIVQATLEEAGRDIQHSDELGCPVFTTAEEAIVAKCQGCP